MLTNKNIPMIIEKMRIIRKTRQKDSEMSVEDIFFKYALSILEISSI